MRSAVRNRFAAAACSVVVAPIVTFGAHVTDGRHEQVFHD
jgi:hypothetical protein